MRLLVDCCLGVVAWSLVTNTVHVRAAMAFDTLTFSSSACEALGLDAAVFTGGCARLTMCAASDASGALGYRRDGGACESAPGPTVRVAPGATYGLVFCVPTTFAADDWSNVHTHGLHVSGSGNSDDITRHVSPGDCVVYQYDVARDHMGGTNWYHAHAHGHTERHVSSGLYGVVLVGENERVFAAADAAEGNATADADVRAFLANDLLLVIAYRATGRDEGQWYGNRAAAGDTFDVVDRQWYRLRMLMVRADAEPEQLVFGAGCQVHAVAHDGVYRRAVPRAAASNRYVMTGASRLDVALRCDKSAAGESGRVELRVGNGAGHVVARFTVVDGAAASSATPFRGTGPTAAPWASWRPAYLRSLLDATADTTFSVRMDRDTLNGLHYSERCALKADGGADFVVDHVQQWHLSNTDKHPFHVHLYHMQVVQPGGCGWHEHGEWYDTIAYVPDDRIGVRGDERRAANSGGTTTCLVRFRLADIGGRVVLHCHVLEHEDAGAMAWINVVADDTNTSDNSTQMPAAQPCCQPGHTCSARASTCVSTPVDLGEPCSASTVARHAFVAAVVPLLLFVCWF